MPLACSLATAWPIHSSTAKVSIVVSLHDPSDFSLGLIRRLTCYRAAKLSTRFPQKTGVLRRSHSNHSCAPNCEVEKTPRALWVIALGDIPEGEELTYNYGYDFDPDTYQDFPCHCGATQCCGYILAQEYWTLLPLPHSQL